MDVSLGVLAVAFVVTFGVVKLLKPVAFVIDLVDRPGGRKRHEGAIPLVGGIAIYSGVFIAAYAFLDQPLFMRLFMLGGGFLVFLGALDDRYDLSARSRLIGQLLVAALFVYGLELKLGNFGNLLGLGDIRVAWLGYPLAILSLVGVINAFNMLDGLDGLVGSVALICFAGLSFLFGAAGEPMLAMLSMAFIGAMGAFLLFNIWGRQRAPHSLDKIFMGDAGSMYVGLSVGVLLIQGSQVELPAFLPVTALWFVLLPMTDMFTIMYRRIKRGHSPMAPDRTHIHHILMRAGFTPIQTLYIMVLCQGLLVTLGIVTTVGEVPEAVSFAAMLLFVGLYQLLMKRSWRFIRWSKRRLGAS